MGYVSKSDIAKLYMGTSTADTLPAIGADVMREVPLLGSMKTPKRSIATAFFNILNDKLRRSVGGKTQDKIWTGGFVVDDDEQVHRDFVTDAEGETKRNWRAVLVSGRIHEFVGFVSSYDEDELQASDTPDAWLAQFEITQDGGDTVIYP